MIFRQLFDPETSTYTYLLADGDSKQAILIDPVLERSERDMQLLTELGLKLVYTLDTHVHADHVTASGTLRNLTGAKVVLSHKSGAEGADVYVRDGDTIEFGRHVLEVRSTPGHTDGCISFVSAERRMVFTGDALLIRGSGRTDFQQGDPRTLYRSVRDKVLTLPDDTLVYPGHDYKGRTVSTVVEERAYNPRLGDHTSEEQFVQIMDSLGLPSPKRIDAALPANLKCGAPADAATPAAPKNAWSRVKRTTTGVPEVDLLWLQEVRSNVRLIDVRQPEEFDGELGHLSGAQLVPLDMLAHEAKQWDPATHIVTVCRSGGRSGKAALSLESMGFHHVASLAGGMLQLRAQQR